MSNPYLKQYQKNQIETSSQEQILVLLYDGAIQFLNKAKIAMSQKDIEVIHNNIIGAQRIITEFMSTLDMEIGGEFAQNLYSLYEYLYTRLVHANLKKDEAALDEVIYHLKELRDTWKQAIIIAAKEKSSNTSLIDSYNNEDEAEDNEDDEKEG